VPSSRRPWIFRQLRSVSLLSLDCDGDSMSEIMSSMAGSYPFSIEDVMSGSVLLLFYEARDSLGIAISNPQEWFDQNACAVWRPMNLIDDGN
jgi:hypothetical protein